MKKIKAGDIIYEKYNVETLPGVVYNIAEVDVPPKKQPDGRYKIVFKWNLNLTQNYKTGKNELQAILHSFSYDYVESELENISKPSARQVSLVKREGLKGLFETTSSHSFIDI